MRSIKSSILVAAVLALLFTACNSKETVRTTLVEFDNVILKDSVFKIDTIGSQIDTTIYLVNHGVDLSGKFIASNIWFLNSYDTIADSWTGFACSSRVDTLTMGIKNIYGCAVGLGATNTVKFGLIHNTATMICDSLLYGTNTLLSNPYGNFTIKNLMIANSTYAYLSMKNGSANGKKFAADDWFKLIITGYLNNGQTGQVDFYLADFRDGKTFLSKTWTKVDVSALGKVDKVIFTIDSSDKTGTTINTPPYACIDNIELTQIDIAK
jgi:hypothetical protein